MFRTQLGPIKIFFFNRQESEHQSFLLRGEHAVFKGHVMPALPLDYRRTALRRGKCFRCSSDEQGMNVLFHSIAAGACAFLCRA